MEEIKPYNLFLLRRFDEAEQACRVILKNDPDDSNTMTTLASILQAKGKYAEALPLYERLLEIENNLPRVLGRSTTRRMDISSMQWLMGAKEEGKQTMRGTVAGVLDGFITHADLAGGVSPGIRLYYMAITTQDEKNAEYALSYLRKLNKKRRIQYWPGPIVKYLFDEIDMPVLLNEACGCSEVETACQLAMKDDALLVRRHLSVALFHIGIKCRAHGDEERCMEWMQRCISIKNPLIENEWYYAQYEMKQAETKL